MADLIEEGFHEHLTADAGVSAITTRGYPVKAPQDVVLPCWVYQKLSGPREHSHDGASGDAHPRIRIRCYAKSYPGAKALANAARIALDGFSGTMGDNNTCVVGAVFLANEIDGWDEEAKADFVSLDFTCWHKEATS